jgi:hypothetical protein
LMDDHISPSPLEDGSEPGCRDPDLMHPRTRSSNSSQAAECLLTSGDSVMSVVT